MAIWPPTLPPPLYDGYAVTPLDQTIRTDMESGAKRARRRTLASRDTITAQVKLTWAEWQEFRAWYNDADGADGGSGWFTIDLLTGYTSATLETVEARFSGPWAQSVITASTVTISLPLEVRYA